MTQRNERKQRIMIRACLGATLVFWAAHASLARVERPRLAGTRAAVAEGPAAPASVARRVPADVAARLVLGDAHSGPMIRVLEGDRVTLKIQNPADAGSSRTLHFADLAGAGDVRAGPIPPGDSGGIAFVAGNPGLYPYAALSEQGTLTGLLLVEPIYGYRRADREYFMLMGGDFPTGDDALTAGPGERVRLFVANPYPAAKATLSFGGQVTETSVVKEGNSTPLEGMSVDVGPGGCAILELDIGEVGEVELLAKINGADGLRGVMLIEEIQVAEEERAAAPAGALEMTPELEAKVAAGKAVFGRTCIACHQATGLGIPGVYPPLAESDYLLADVDRAIHGVIKGQQGDIIVNGARYNMLMPPQILNDEEIAQVLTYVMSSWGNPGEDISVERVKAIREKAQ